jgi:hypothetical protein
LIRVTSSNGNSGDVKNRECVEELLWLRIFKSSVGLVPSSTFQVKSVDVDTFSRGIELFALNPSIITLDDFLKDI